MGSQINSAPPSIKPRRGDDDGWAELVCGLRPGEAAGLGGALVRSNIEHRKFRSDRRMTVMVLRFDLADAQFVQAAWAFHQPAARKPKRWGRASRAIRRPVVMIAIAALLAAGASTLSAPHRAGAETACRTSGDSYLMVPRGGCTQIAPAADLP